MEFAEFILAHEADDLAQLALSRSRYAGEVADFDLALTTLECRQKLRGKVPEWYALPQLRFPLRLSAEQCSSSATARYKATVAASACANGAFSIADLTGGLGVDAWAFSQLAAHVLYNEMQPALAQAAQHNFSELGMKHVTVRNGMLVAGRSPVKPGMTVAVKPGMTGEVGPAMTVGEVLAGFRADILYLDPARRSGDGRKVFRLEDCTPPLLELLPELLEACPRVLVKLSPMADISRVCAQLGCVKEVHVVAAGGECKELLLLLQRDWTAPYSLFVFEDGAVLSLSPEDLDIQPAEAPALTPGSWLFEPGKGLGKAGAFGLPVRRYGLAKLERHTHLYLSASPLPRELVPFGKVYELEEVLPLNKRTVKDLGKRFPRAEVTARNITLSSDALRDRLGVASGGDVHLFGVRIQGGEQVLLVTRRLEDGVRPSLRAYLENAVIPQYAAFDKAHREDHARCVMDRAMAMGRTLDLDPELLLTAAACHDLGLSVDRKTHHLESGRIIRGMQELGRWFTPGQVETIAQAAEDHRASATEPPRSLYGSVVAEADRMIEPLTIIRRTVQFGMAHYPELNKEGHWQRTLEHLLEKYAEGGYLHLLIPGSPNEEPLRELRTIIADRAQLRDIFETIYAEERL